MKFPGSALLFLIVLNSAQSQNRINTIDSVLTVMSERHQFNGSILIVKNDSVALDKQYGYTTCTFKEKLSGETAFHLASVSKPITVLGIMLLAEKGLLNIDSAITKYLPELPYRTITVRHLLTHTSGLPDYIALYESIIPDSVVVTNNWILNDFIQKKYQPEFQAGEEFSYTSTNYVLLACIIEKVSGKTFPVYIEETVFKPLGMDHSFVRTPLLKNNKAAAEPYENNYGIYTEINSFPWSSYGGHGIYSTTEDLYKLDRALYTDKLLPQNTIKQMYQPMILNNGNRSKYGLGWETDTCIVFHAGGWMGYRAQFNRDLCNKNVFILLDNSNNRDWIEIVEMIEQILNGESFSIPVFRIARKLDINELNKYTGTYELRKNYHIDIKIQDERLYIYIPGRESMEICPETKETFFLKELNKGTTFNFVFNEKEEIEKMIIDQRGTKIETMKIKTKED